jgi:hypothetical protein
MTGSTAERRRISRLICGVTRRFCLHARTGPWRPGFPVRGLACIDFELVIWRPIVAAVSGIGVEPFDRIADDLLDRRDDLSQRMAIIGTARQCLHVDDELAPLQCLRVVATLALTPNS